MQATIRYCDLCIKDFNHLRLATGFYTTQDGKSWDVCTKHTKEVEGYGLPELTVHRFSVIGNSIDLKDKFV